MVYNIYMASWLVWFVAAGFSLFFVIKLLSYIIIKGNPLNVEPESTNKLMWITIAFMWAHFGVRMLL
jgi:hypothetical protein